MNKGGANRERGDRTRFPYEPRVIGGRLLVIQADFKIHRTLLDAAEVEIISDDASWWKAYGPSWRTSCRGKQGYREIRPLSSPDRPRLRESIRTDRDYTVY